jgi:CRISPR/Cas system CSM-associated protein Csm3 (group 7 of RAMP superfamily)
MRDDDDDFDLSLEDEAEFLAVTEAAENGKRKGYDEEEPPNKKAKRDASPSTELANRVLKERFGLESFRLKQEAAITRLLDGQSAVIVFPTGAGTMLTYEHVCVTYADFVRRNCRQKLVLSSASSGIQDTG